jgi:hypothetical protein
MPAINLAAEREPWGDSGLESATQELGAMVTAFNRFPAGFDCEAVARAMLGDGLCTAPHWGVVISGSVGVRYTDGREEIARAGEAFYLAPGHAPFSREGAEIIEFTLAADNAALMEKVAAFMATQENAET